MHHTDLTTIRQILSTPELLREIDSDIIAAQKGEPLSMQIMGALACICETAAERSKRDTHDIASDYAQATVEAMRGDYDNALETLGFALRYEARLLGTEHTLSAIEAVEKARGYNPTTREQAEDRGDWEREVERDER